MCDTGRRKSVISLRRWIQWGRYPHESSRWKPARIPSHKDCRRSWAKEEPLSKCMDTDCTGLADVGGIQSPMKIGNQTFIEEHSTWKSGLRNVHWTGADASGTRGSGQAPEAPGPRQRR